MYGVKAYLIFAMFALCASILLGATFLAWKNRRENSGLPGLVALTAFVLLWFCLFSRGYVQKARFHFRLSRLDAADVYSIKIGRHDFRDSGTIQEVVGALQRSR